MKKNVIIIMIFSLFFLVQGKQTLYSIFIDLPQYREYNQRLFTGINDFCQNKKYRLISFSYKNKKDIKDRVKSIKEVPSAVVFCGPWLKDVAEWLYKERGNRFSDIMLFDGKSEIREISCLTIDRVSTGMLLGIDSCIISGPYLFLLNQDLPFLKDIYDGVGLSLKKRNKNITLKTITTDILYKKNFYKYIQDKIRDYNGIFLATGPITGVASFSGELLNKKLIVYGNLTDSEVKYPSIKIISYFNLTNIMTRFLERCLYRRKGLDMNIGVDSSEFTNDRHRLTLDEKLKILRESRL